jgi:PPOX class probable FMN-dependent enzyme
MSPAPWRSPLAIALERNPHSTARYVQLATVGANNRPANRTVVFRGFLLDSDQLKFVIDARSQKVVQIKQQPWAEACWYFPETREQFRFSGSLTLVQADYPDLSLQQARQTTWQRLSNATRIQYTWPNPGEARSDAAAFGQLAPDPVEPLPHFCLLLLEPVQVEHLELRGEPQNRWIYYRDRHKFWSTQAINP